MARNPSSAKPVLIVVGAHLSAEVYDRPLAYRLRERVLEALQEPSRGDSQPDRVIVCSDLWYLNRDPLRELPTISVGGPAVNAFTAYLGDKLPSAFAIDGQLIVQADWGNRTPLACCWGIDAQRTALAVETFAEKYLEQWLGAVDA